jgi:dihydroorotase
MEAKFRNVIISDTQSAMHGNLADITVSDGIITEIVAAGNSQSTAELLLDGHALELPADRSSGSTYVSPGWVDVFADYREPGLEQKETLATGLAAAAAGGFTDVLVLPGTLPTVSTRSMVASMLQRSAGYATQLHPLGAVSKDIEGKELAEMLDMRTGGAIAFTDGWKPVQNANLMLKALEYVKAFDGTVIQMPVELSLAKGGIMHDGLVATQSGLTGIPPLAETLLIYRDIELASYTGSKLHITGVTTAEGLEMIRQAKAKGVAVTCSVTPYHLALTHERLSGYDSNYKVNPPLRPEADRAALIAGVLDGTVDCFASHHRPHEWDAKTKELDLAAEGMAIQESAFQIIYSVLGGLMSTHTLTNLLSAKPRGLFGLPPAAIAVGSPAIFTVFDTDCSHTFTLTTNKSKAVNHPFTEIPFRGKIFGIFNRNNFKNNL